MKTIKLSTKGQLVIPKQLRETHHLVVGTEFVVSFVGNEIRLKPLPMFPPTTVADAAGLLAQRGKKKMSGEEKDERGRTARKYRKSIAGR